MTQNTSISRTEVIAELKRVYFNYFENSRMTTGNFRKHSKISYLLVLQYFETWENALNLADVNCQPKKILYDKEIILDSLKTVYLRHFENTKMTFKKFSTHSKVSYYLILKYFDSWENAMNQAEINSSVAIQLAQENEIITALRQVYFDYFENTSMTFKNFQAHSKINYNSLLNYFGSWANAVHKAELNYNSRRIYTKEMLCNELKRVSLLYPENTRLTITNYNLHSKINFSTVCKHFGSWNNALIEAQINFGEKRHPYSKETIVATLRWVYSLYTENTRLTISKFGLHSKISIVTIRKYFDSWENALKQSQINYPPKSLTQDEKTIVTILRTVYFEHFENTTMSYKKFRLHSKLSIRPIITHFGSWSNAITKAQIKYNSKPLPTSN
jgi:hypothetical protein